MKPQKLHAPEELVGRVVRYAAFIEQHRSMLKEVGGNTKPVLTDLAKEAQDVKVLSEKVDKAENEFLNLRAELKARSAELDVKLSDQVTYAKEFAKRHKLTVLREGLQSFGHNRKQKRASADAPADGPASKPSA